MANGVNLLSDSTSSDSRSAHEWRTI